MTTNNPCVGGVVMSTAGRDKGKYFVIIRLENDGFVRIADGKSRRLANPKLKKLKHLRVLDKVLGDIEAKLTAGLAVTDAGLRKALKAFDND